MTMEHTERYEYKKILNEPSGVDDRFRFADFLTRRWCAVSEIDVIDEELRNTAYKRFLKAIKIKRLVKYSIIKQYFGIRSLSIPNRRRVIELAFALMLDASEAESYLKDGLCDTGFIFSDHEEFLAMYCLDRHLPISEWQSMVKVFERHIDDDTVIQKRSNTAELKLLYERIAMKSQEEFLAEMLKLAGMFKGYSKTALNTLIDLKERLFEIRREDAKKMLELKLSETGYKKWIAEHPKKGESDSSSIMRYLRYDKMRKNPDVSTELRNVLLTDYWIAYSSKDKNKDLLEELYGVEKEKLPGLRKRIAIKNDALGMNIRLMTDKYLSDLLRIAVLSEKEIRLRSAVSRLEAMDMNAELPSEYRYLLEDEKPVKVFEALKLLNGSLDDLAGRRHVIGRNDLLPLIHYVVMKTEPNRDFFISYSNQLLLKCDMPLINEGYALDRLLINSFGAEDYYYFAEILEMLE